MTGEITLRGKLMPIGGLKEKLLAAYRAGVKTVILPEENRKDSLELPAEIKKGIKLKFFSELLPALKYALDKNGQSELGKCTDSIKTIKKRIKK